MKHSPLYLGYPPGSCVDFVPQQRTDDMDRMKYDVHRVQYEEMSDDLVASAREVVGRAQLSVTLSATNMFWTRLNFYSPIGAMIVLVVWWFVTPYLHHLPSILDNR